MKVKGSVILDALENAVSGYPEFEGRFPGVSGLTLKWNSGLPPGKRVTEVVDDKTQK